VYEVWLETPRGIQNIVWTMLSMTFGITSTV
jgi:hypothetical protein